MLFGSGELWRAATASQVVSAASASHDDALQDVPKGRLRGVDLLRGRGGPPRAPPCSPSPHLECTCCSREGELWRLATASLAPGAASAPHGDALRELWKDRVGGVDHLRGRGGAPLASTVPSSFNFVELMQSVRKWAALAESSPTSI